MEQLISHLPAMEQEAAALERRARALRQIIAGLKELGDQPTAAVTQPQLIADATLLAANGSSNGNGFPKSGREAVLTILRERGRNWTVKTLARESERRRWPTSRKAIEHAVQALYREGAITKVRTGVYRLAKPEEVTR